MNSGRRSRHVPIHGSGKGVVRVLLEHGGGNSLNRLGANICCEFFLCIVEFDLDLPELVLEDGDEADTSVDGVPETRLGLVREGLNGVVSLRRAELVEKLRHVAGAENLVHVSEPLRVVRRKVRREHALLRALSPQKLARRARRVR